VFNSTFLEIYDIPAEQLEKIQKDDSELMKLSFEWIRQVMFAEATLKFKEGVLEKRKERSDKTMRKVYGNKPKAQIGEID